MGVSARARLSRALPAAPLGGWQSCLATTRTQCRLSADRGPLAETVFFGKKRGASLSGQKRTYLPVRFIQKPREMAWGFARRGRKLVSCATPFDNKVRQN